MPIFKDNYKLYLSLGLTPFPASPQGKNPIERWKNKKISEINYSKWENKYADANIWVRLDNFVVIDPDGFEAEKFVQSLNLPLSPISESGHKSVHRWFKSSSKINPFKKYFGNKNDVLEIRTGNMGMLVPPSIHPQTGKSYKWREGFSPKDIPFPEFPMEILEKLEELNNKPLPKDNNCEIDWPFCLDVKSYLDHYGVRYKVKELGDGRILYVFNRCLFHKEHTSPDKIGDSGIIQGPDGKLGFHCFHNHCNSKTWSDVRKAISKNEPIAQFLRKKILPVEGNEINSWDKAVISLDEINKMKCPEKKKILYPWLSEQSIVMIAGWRGIGKTWFALSLINAIVHGENFGPWVTVNPVSCIYIDGEMSLQDIQERIELLNSSAQKEFKARLFFYSDYLANYYSLPKANLLNPEFRNWLKYFCLIENIKLIVIDNLSSLSPGIDENSKKDWDEINQWLLELRFNGLSVIILHHTGKEGQQRGTSSHEDNVDVSIKLELPSNYVPEDGARFIVKFTKTRLRQKDLPLIANLEFKLFEEDGKIQWLYANSKKNYAEILKLYSQGHSQKEIANKVNISKSQVSKIISSFKKGGLILDDGTLTPKGASLLATHPFPNPVFN